MPEPYTLHLGDCLLVLPSLPDNSVDAVVTDPPYGLSFMGKNWDHGVPGEQFWREVLRVAKPGAHLLAFGGTRTYHRLACAIEDAGWEIRDCLMWCHGQGFPKSLNLKGDSQGWGTALKPAWEPIILARKPLQGTVAENVLQYGTGGINVDGCRVGTADIITNHSRGSESAISKGKYGDSKAQETHQTAGQALGRWPANLLHDGSDEVVGLFPQYSSPKKVTTGGKSTFATGRAQREIKRYGDLAAAARFFQACPDNDPEDAQARLVYCAKASKRDRNEGCEGLEERTAGECTDRTEGSAGLNSPRAGAGRTSGSRNHHPTVKPTSLMRYLCRLVTPPGGTVLDPFMGSGSTGKACGLEGFQFIGIEQSPEYMPIASARVAFGYGTPAPMPEPTPAPPEPAQEGQLSLF